MEEVGYNNVVEAVGQDVNSIFPYAVREFGAIDLPHETGDIISDRVSIHRLKESLTKTLIEVACDFRLKGDIERKRNVAFLVKYWMPTKLQLPDGLLIRGEPWKKEAAQYGFLSEISSVPHASLIKDVIQRNNGLALAEVNQKIMDLRALPRALLIEFCGDEILEKAFEDLKGDRTGRCELVMNRLESIVNFQKQATGKYIEGVLRYENLTSLTRERSMEDRAIDYTRACKGLDHIRNISPSEMAKIGKVYRVIANTPNNSEVVLCHGDMIPPNIITDQKDKFIDMQLKLGDGILDIASLVSWPGITLRPEDWDQLAYSFREKEAENDYRKIRGSTDRVTIRDTLSSLYKLIIHNSWKYFAKIQDIKRSMPEEFPYSEMVRKRPVFKNAEADLRSNIMNAMNYLTRYPAHCGLRRGEIGKLRELEEFFKEIGVLVDDLPAKIKELVSYRIRGNPVTKGQRQRRKRVGTKEKLLQ